jgi:hypothetical protein
MMSSVFNDFLHQTISASTIVAGTCHLLQNIPQVPQIPEIEKMKRITLGIGTIATAAYGFMHCNKKNIKRLVLGIKLAALAGTVHYIYHRIPSKQVSASPPTLPPAAGRKLPIVDLGTGIAATAKTAQDAYNLVPSRPVSAPPPTLPPAAVIKPLIMGLGNGIAATPTLIYDFLTNKKIHKLARIAAVLITIHSAYNLVRGSTVTPPPPPPPPVPPPPPPPRITQGTQTGSPTERSTQEIANLALISMVGSLAQTPKEIDGWIQQSAANVTPAAAMLGADRIVHQARIPTPEIAGTPNTFDFTQALNATEDTVRSTGRAQGGLLRINGLYKSIVIAPSLLHAGQFVYRYFNPIASVASVRVPTASIIEMGDPKQFTDFLNSQAQPFWPSDPPNTVCTCIPCIVK